MNRHRMMMATMREFGGLEMEKPRYSLRGVWMGQVQCDELL